MTKSQMKKLRLGRFTKSITNELPFLTDFSLSNDSQAILDLNPLTHNQTQVNPVFQNLTLEETPNTMCVQCKGKDLACGKTHCPIISKLSVYKQISSDLQTDHIFGASPPGVFIGRYGYPRISIGPMVPPDTGDTSLYDTTERWFGLSLSQILSFRMRLVRGKFQVNINNLDQSNRMLTLTQEMGLAKDSIEAEVSFRKKPVQKITLETNVAPMGPVASLRKLDLGSSKTDHRIEKAYTDTDLFAKDAIINLQKNNVNQTAITRAFSLGLFGHTTNRKLVPTRWSITSVDSTLGLNYWREIQHFPFINEIRVFESTYMGNRFVILMFPAAWGYELMEAWFPNSAWNPGHTIAMVNDYEGLRGRKNYARIGGCYYSGRNMVGEYLNNERRQARTVILRETYPGQQMPMGVWLVREMIRKALEFPYKKFDTLSEAFEYIQTRLLIKSKEWIKTSGILSHAPETKQKSLYSFITK